MSLALFFPIKTPAAATSFIILLVFGCANASLIVLERRDPAAPLDIPRPARWLGLLLWLAFVGASS
ncbi:MAG: hypothetical protein PVF91_03985 [Chromatiales bacterium]